MSLDNNDTLENRICLINKQLEDILDYLVQNLEAEVYFTIKNEQLISILSSSHAVL